MRSQNFNPAGGKIFVVGNKFPSIMAAGFGEEAVIEIVAASLEVRKEPAQHPQRQTDGRDGCRV